MRGFGGFVVVAAIVAAHPRTAFADVADGGDASAAAPDAAGPDSGAGSGDDGGGAAGNQSPPLACDGSLCDTTNDATCTATRHASGGASDGFHIGGAVFVVVGTLVVAVARRIRRERRA
jgi:hypothetical protein